MNLRYTKACGSSDRTASSSFFALERARFTCECMEACYSHLASLTKKSSVFGPVTIHPFKRAIFSLSLDSPSAGPTILIDMLFFRFGFEIYRAVSHIHVTSSMSG
jgi:hypothetical protein